MYTITLFTQEQKTCHLDSFFLHQCIGPFFAVNCGKVQIGEIGYCSCNNQCSENEGDCDFDNQCQGRQKCRSNLCPSSLGFDSNTDCCGMPSLGDEDFCSTDDPCGLDEGHCDWNSECRNDLSCGFRNCPNGLNETDCCEPKGKYFTPGARASKTAYIQPQSLHWQKIPFSWVVTNKGLYCIIEFKFE